MTIPHLLAWTLGIGVLTLTGSLSARKYNRSDLLIALTAGLAAAAQPLMARMTLPFAGRDLPVHAGLPVLALSFLPLIAIVEKFAQREGHRVALFATVAGLAGALGTGWAAGFPSPATALSAPAGAVEHSPWIALAGLTGYLMGANLCVVLYHMLRVITSDRKLWLRAPLAVMAGGLVESCVTLPLAYGGRDPLGPFIAGRLAVWTWVALATIPLAYLHRAAQGRKS